MTRKKNKSMHSGEKVMIGIGLISVILIAVVVIYTEPTSLYNRTLTANQIQMSNTPHIEVLKVGFGLQNSNSPSEFLTVEKGTIVDVYAFVKFNDKGARGTVDVTLYKNKIFPVKTFTSDAFEGKDTMRWIRTGTFTAIEDYVAKSGSATGTIQVV